MKKLLAVLMVMGSMHSEAVKLSDYKPYKFEVLFTNPVCDTYKYDRPVIAVSGKTLTNKPQNVYCKPGDEDRSTERPNAPQYRLKEWIEASDTKEIHLAYLSFSSPAIRESLCKAARNGVKLRFVLDGDEKTDTNKNAESLKKCGDKAKVETYYRGETGGLGYAHNKIMVINPGAETVKVVFSSGNLSTGTSTNHENWNFVTTSGKSYFAAAHKCVIESMITGGDSKENFKAKLNDCRSKIEAPPESDIKTFFSPVDGRAALKAIATQGERSDLLEAMSHRFSGDMAKLFAKLLSDKKEIHFILDDDIYWAMKLKKDVGRNMSIEAYRIYSGLIDKGMNTRFLETNQNVYQLQHNKFVIFSEKGKGTAVFNGAGNFTSAAFNKNFENFYLITVPEVIEAYKKQYAKYFNEMATTSENMPRDYVLP
jgi:hypothetical protein